MKVSILKKDQILNESMVDENTLIDKGKFSTIVLISKVIVAMVYAFGLGYSLFFLGENYIKVGIKFLSLLIISYIFIDFPYSFLKALFLPKVFNKDTINLQVNPYTLAIDISSRINISIVRIIMSIIIPFILLAIIPTIASYILEFNMYLYLLASSSAIIATKDIIYLILIIKKYSKGSKIKLSTNQIIFYL
ncbi:metalloprotease family protein [Clostridium nigeriense]|uniref:metalloprotease family protein n=1 Tax=Clostridium nigeriense TaxID=1805470 RepID=UPI003D336C80